MTILAAPQSILTDHAGRSQGLSLWPFAQPASQRPAFASRVRQHGLPVGGAFVCPIDPDCRLPMVHVDDLMRGLIALQEVPHVDRTPCLVATRMPLLSRAMCLMMIW